MALGPVFDAVSDWILEPNRQHVEPEEVVSDRENSRDSRDRNNQQQSGSGVDRNDRKDMRGRNGREERREGGGGGGDINKEETRGLAGYFFSALYNAGASLFTGDFAALSLGSDAEDDTQVPIYLPSSFYLPFHSRTKSRFLPTVSFLFLPYKGNFSPVS